MIRSAIERYDSSGFDHTNTALQEKRTDYDKDLKALQGQIKSNMMVRDCSPTSELPQRLESLRSQDHDGFDHEFDTSICRLLDQSPLVREYLEN